MEVSSRVDSSMKLKGAVIRIFGAIVLVMSFSTSAQMTPHQQTQVPDSNPNSAHYNSRYLPSLGSSNAQQRLEDRFGALAMSRKTGKSGWFQDAATEQEADMRALEQCRQRSDLADDCEILISFQNQCAVVVRSERHTGYARAGDIVSARQAAMDSCEALGGICEVFREGCSYPVLAR